jgi:hypothetical protein
MVSVSFSEECLKEAGRFRDTPIVFAVPPEAPAMFFFYQMLALPGIPKGSCRVSLFYSSSAMNNHEVLLETGAWLH